MQQNHYNAGFTLVIFNTKRKSQFFLPSQPNVNIHTYLLEWKGKRKIRRHQSSSCSTTSIQLTESTPQNPFGLVSSKTPDWPAMERQYWAISLNFGTLLRSTLVPSFNVITISPHSPTKRGTTCTSFITL